MYSTAGSACPVCHQSDSEPLLTVPRAPVSCGQLFPTREAAVTAGQCKLGIDLCNYCHHIWNTTYDDGSSTIYNQDYYSSFTASAQGRGYQDSLAGDLDRVIGLAGKTVLEIGCGDGYFLKSVHSRGASAIGFEPSSTFHVANSQPGVEVHQDHFAFDALPELDSTVDVVVMRHILEHLPSPISALESLHPCASDRSGPRFLFLEVPNVLQILKDNLYFDFYNDHVQYFSYDSLARLSRSAGWTPLTTIGGDLEFLRLVCVASDDSTDRETGLGDTPVQEAQTSRENEDVILAAAKFRQEFHRWKGELADLLTGYRSDGKSVAVWGAGARGVALLSGIDLPGDTYQYIVDSDPNKHGKFLPVIHQPVSSPERLCQEPVDYILVTSYTYFDEISAQLEWFRSNGGKAIKIYPSPAVL